MDIELKRPWFIQGYRLKKGVNVGVPDRFHDQLPSDAKVLVGPAGPGAAAEVRHVDPDHKAKLFAGIPANFFTADKEKSVTKEEAVAKAVEGEGGLEKFNALGQTDRKDRIQRAANQLLGEAVDPR